MAIEEKTEKHSGATVNKREGTVDAQAPDTSREAGGVKTAEVKEVEIRQNTVITDPESEDAVQLGEPGSLDLPADRASNGSPEERFEADSKKKSSKKS